MKSIMEEASSIVKAIEAAWIRAEKPHEFSVKVFEEPEKNFFGMVTKSAKIALIFKHVEKKSSHKDQSAHSKAKSTHHVSEPTFTAHPKEYARKETIVREPREYRERESREQREPMVREPRESRELREERKPRDVREREPREQREPMVREPRQPREPRETREPMVREVREREPREHREPVVREPREPREPREAREPMMRPDREFNADQNVQEKIFWTEEMIDTTRAWIDTLLKNMNCSDIAFTLEAKRYYLTVSFDKSVRETKSMEQQLFRSCAYLIMQMLRTKLKKQFRGLKVVLHSPAQQ